MDIHIYRAIDSFNTEVMMMRISAKRMICDLSFVAGYAKAKSVIIAFFHKGKVVKIAKPIMRGFGSTKNLVAAYVNEYKENN